MCFCQSALSKDHGFSFWNMSFNKTYRLRHKSGVFRGKASTVSSMKLLGKSSPKTSRKIAQNFGNMSTKHWHFEATKNTMFGTKLMLFAWGSPLPKCCVKSLQSFAVLFAVFCSISQKFRAEICALLPSESQHFVLEIPRNVIFSGICCAWFPNVLC